MLVYAAPALACKLFFAAKTTYDTLTLGSYRFIGTQVIYVALFTLLAVDPGPHRSSLPRLWGMDGSCHL